MCYSQYYAPVFVRIVILCRTYASMEDLVVDYRSGNLNSDDVKRAFRKGINNILKVTFAFLIVCIQITPKVKC
jgi:hypothetical protein